MTMTTMTERWISSRGPQGLRRFWTPREDDDETFVKHEPMLFRTSLTVAHTLGGPITRAFLASLPPRCWDRGANALIDSRVHMLMPNWWPAIPGWHHDDVERSRSDGQPNYENPSYRPEFLMGIVGSADCSTEFAIGEMVVPEVPLGGIHYKEWHPLVVEAVRNGTLGRMDIQPNYVYSFNDRDWHQAVPCKNTGWRWFGRVTLYSPHEPVNEVRRQTNVYMDNPMEGW